MHSIFASLPARTASQLSRALSALLPLLLAVVAIALPGCTNHQETPLTLFAHIQELNVQGKSREIWHLYTDDERERQGDAWDSYREFLSRNPRDDNRAACRRNFGMDPEEIMGLAHVELFEVLNRGTEQAMVDARVTDDEPATDLENAHRVYWVTAAGEKCVMLAQYVNGDWYLVTLRE